MCREQVVHLDVEADRSLLPGIRIVGQDQDCWPQIVIDSMGHAAYLVQMTNKDPDENTAPTTTLGMLVRAF